ncbi:OmpA family protein [Massilia sp. TWR1-2-2]|uniref:OmpA family protein n=1 Tax=Massilia sp. TWR1-2-2 TaxID=2804584 RepID=UPI003CEE6357
MLEASRRVHFTRLLIAILLFTITVRAQALPPQQPCHVFFTNDSYFLTSEATTVLNDLLQDFRKARKGVISIVGYADRTGSASYNLKLSKNRARTVGKFFRNSLGLQYHKFEISWKGESSLPYPTEDGVPEPYNRCVNVALNST